MRCTALLSSRNIGIGLVALAAVACTDSPTTVVMRPISDRPLLAVAGKPPIDQTLEGESWVCKDGTGPATSFSFAVSIDGGAATNYSIALGTCTQVANFPVTPGQQFFHSVSVTETVPTNWAISSIVIESNTSNTTLYQPVTSAPNASSRISHDWGTVVTFTNTFTPPPPPNVGGRMTGGGVQIFNDIKITRGFTIHCDITLSNNIEINWPGNKWHLDKPITKATCIDDPAYDETPPVAPFNTFIGEAIGRLNGVDGSKLYFTFIDAGEPGKNDKAALKIIAPDGVTVVLDVPLRLLDNGNIQAHYDQPHGQKP